MLRVQFASTTYSALESSGEMFVSIAIRGGVSSNNVSVDIYLLRLTATG